MAFVRLDTHVLMHKSRNYPTHKMSFKREGSILRWERLMIIWAMAVSINVNKPGNMVKRNHNVSTIMFEGWVVKDYENPKSCNVRGNARTRHTKGEGEPTLWRCIFFAGFWWEVPNRWHCKRGLFRLPHCERPTLILTSSAKCNVNLPMPYWTLLNNNREGGSEKQTVWNALSLKCVFCDFSTANFSI